MGRDGVRMVFEQLETREDVVEREWCVEGIPVLTVRVSLPVVVDMGKARCRKRIQRYYRQFCRSYLHYCESFLLPRAELEFRQALATSASLPQASANLTYQITHNENGLWSLFCDAREKGLGPSLRVRRGDCWSLERGAPLPLSACFPPRSAYRRLLADVATAEIRRQTESGAALYREGWQSLVRRELSGENFYISPAGLHFFYQMYTLAPGAEGVPTFCLPWGEGGAQLPQ